MCDGQQIFRGSVNTSNGRTAYIFASDSQLDLLSATSALTAPYCRSAISTIIRSETYTECFKCYFPCATFCYQFVNDGSCIVGSANSTYIFRSCVFRRCGLVLSFSILTFSTLPNSYLRFQQLRFPSSGIAQFHSSHLHTCVFQDLHFQPPPPTPKARLEIMHSFVHSFVSLMRTLS